MLGIVAYGVVGNKVFAAVPRIPLDDSERILFTLALATAVLTFAVIEWASKESDKPSARSPQPWIRIDGTTALLLVGGLGSSLNEGWIVALVTAIMLSQVGLAVTLHLQRPEPNNMANTT